MSTVDVSDKDLPLKEDTRLLGRMLGDVLRAQAGEDGYARIEAIRQTAIRFRRAVPSEAGAARQSLAAMLNALPLAAVLDVVRAFSYFSHLANIAEDVHQNRRRRAHALGSSPARRGDLADALARLSDAGVGLEAIAAWLSDALISPVLTAHPTEVQRKSILDAEREIARLLTWRDRTTLTPAECAELAFQLRTLVLELWQTAMLRLTRLRVRDEVDNGLAYYRYTFLAEIPRLHALLEGLLRATPDAAGVAVPPFLGWAPGSAAIATAIRSSTPGRSPTRFGRRRASRWPITSTRCTGSAASFRYPRVL